MSNINDKATVSLFVNGEQAESAMERLRNKAADLDKQLQAAMAAGDKKSANKLQRELDRVNKELNKTESAAKGTGIVLDNLANSSLYGLRSALKHLERELKATKPNTEAWHRYAEQINAVKDRIDELNQELEGSKSAWGKFKDWAMNSWPAIDLLSKGSDSVVNGMRQYVEAYAEMDQEMANVRKFTGMSAEEVDALNEELKKIDTRTGREELNKLAQEAGRLGLSSQEDVLGFVRAADKINVALDDLGEGATLTLSKLTDMFGDRERYGVEQSLLKTGSVINELSQSSSAAAPYIANFAERMSGVGIQAGMTVPQIMALGAVLDSMGAQVEASSTAVSQVLVRMMQDPAKYARVAGLEVEKFSQLLKTDANEALLTFLEALNKAGGMDVLAPMFKDMGETGARAVTALSSLAKNIDTVRQRQNEANVAFQEGVSIDKEFYVQNNTVQAGLEKTKNRFHELAVELGEKLAPLMTHFLKTSSAIVRGLLTTIRFVEEHKAAIIALTAAIATYHLVLSKEIIIKKARNAIDTIHYGYLVLESNATKALAVVTEGLQLVYFRLTGQTSKAIVAQKAFSAAMAATPWGAILTAASAALVAYKAFDDELEETKVKYEVLDEAKNNAAKRLGEERVNLTLNIEKIKAFNGTKTEEQQLIQTLNEKYGPILGTYKTLSEWLSTLTTRGNEYCQSIYQQMIMEGKLEQARQLIAEAQKNRDQVDYTPADWYDAFVESTIQWKHGNFSWTSEEEINERRINEQWNKNIKKAEELEARARALIEEANRDAEQLKANAPKVDITTTTPTPPVTPPTNTPSAKDRFSDEKAWREKNEAEARISYARGLSDYEDYKKRMLEIERVYNQLLLDRTDLSANERLKIQADYWEAVNKQNKEEYSLAVADADESYARDLRTINENYAARLVAGNLSAKEREALEKSHTEALEMLELEHLQNLLAITDEGTEERAKLEQQYLDARLKAAQRHQQEYEKTLAEHEKLLASLKNEHFGMNQGEKDAEFKKQFAALTEVYNQELAAASGNEAEILRIKEAYMAAELALRKKYNQEGAEDSKSSYSKAIDASVEWLNGDGGKALTGTLSTLTSGMSSIFSGLSSVIQAELDIQTAKIERRYEREIELAQGNSYKVAKLEKQKEKEIAKVKNEASRKQFSMQVIQAVAQTATNALNAYGSTVVIPIVGKILAPIAAAAALAAGMIQVAAIKKQQQAAEAQGYSKGGFTKPGGVDEPAGIVHAGEWVASQKLLANPVARPMIEALDRAQRTNTIGSLKPEDVSRSIRANDSLSRIAEDDNRGALMVAAFAQNSQAVGALVERLNEPFVTINTVTGPHGINQVQEDYSRLINNVTPKSKRKKWSFS